MDGSMDRRRLLRGTGAIALGTLAGCLGGGGGGDGPTYGDWFEGVDNFAGTVDRTGREGVRVLVGAEGNGGNFAFDPAAVKVTAGTTVGWEWTGEGGEHNVAHPDGRFASEFASRAGHTYEHTFETQGTFRYYCSPHKSLGMRGAVYVVNG